MINKKVLKPIWNNGKGYNAFSSNNAVTGEEVLLITGETMCFWKLEDGTKIKKANTKFEEECKKLTEEQLIINQLTKEYNSTKNKIEKKERNLKFNEYTSYEVALIVESISDLKDKLDDLRSKIFKLHK